MFYTVFFPERIHIFFLTLIHQSTLNPNYMTLVYPSLFTIVDTIVNPSILLGSHPGGKSAADRTMCKCP